MSGISSSIGLVSGIDTARLIDQLIALESRPVQLLQARVKNLDTERTAYAELAAKLLALKNATLGFAKSSFFDRFNSKSSDENSLLATATEKAQPGSATIRIHSLVANHSVVSRSFADQDRTPLGVGTISLESVLGKVNRTTELAELNGGRGVRRGEITITDRSGATATIDLSKAFTLDDVLAAINSNTQVDVHASVTGLALNGASGDRIVLQDTSGGTGNLVVADANAGTTARDLGIAANSATGRIDGRGLYTIDMGTALASLNDGNGIDRFPQGAQADDLVFTTSTGSFGVSLSDVPGLDTNLQALNGGNGVRLGIIRITDRTGASKDIDLTGAKTILDIRDAINNSGLKITSTTVNSFFFITDTTEVDPNTPPEEQKRLKVEDVSGYTAADLGLAQESAGDSIRGRDVYRMSTVGDLVRAINLAAGNTSVEASLAANGKSISLRALNAGETVTVTAGQDASGPASQAAADLGLLNATFSDTQPFLTRRLLGGLNTTMLRTLNGGAGVEGGVVSFTDSSGSTMSIDFTSAQTLQDVTDLINHENATGLTASVNAAGNGIDIKDESGGAGAVHIADVSGTLATDLHIAGDHALGTDALVKGGNLQRQYVSRATRLSDLNGGAGVRIGTMLIHDTAGAVTTVNLTGNLKTVGQVIDAINASAPPTVRARINSTGDGIVVTDAAEGTQKLKIEDKDGGAVAADLKLAGEAMGGRTFIDGSFETRIDLGAADSLSALASKLNAANAGFTANVINDGSRTNPYSLMITSNVSGRHGEMVIDSGGLDLGFSTLTKAQDAIVSLGPSGAGSVLISSSSNQLKDVVPGVTLDLLAPSEHDVTVTTNQDMDSIVTAMQDFVSGYNAVQDSIDKDIQFNPDTQQRGPLLGDATVSTIRGRLQQGMARSFATTSAQFPRMFAVGLRLVSNNRLEFNEDKFRAAYEQSPQEVEKLFSTLKTGFGAAFDETLDGLTQDPDGVISRKDKLLADQQDVFKKRIDSLNLLLDAKRRRLQAQFSGLESTLSALQGQQNSLTTLAQLAAQ